MDDSVALVKLQDDIRHDFSLEISQLRPMRRHQGRTHVYAGELLGSEVVVRLTEGRNACPVEVWAYRQFERLGVPAPRVIAYRENPRRIGHPTVIMPKLPGQRLDAIHVSPDEQGLIYRQLGRLTRRMHELEIPGFGRLEADGGNVVGQHRSWQAVVDGLPRARVVHYLCRHDLVDDEEEELLIGHLNRLDEVRLDQAVFVHGDLHGANVLVDGGRVAGIIDVEGGQAGDPRLDVAVASLWQTSRQREAFAEGYGRLAGDPWVACYRVWVAAQKLAWRHESGRSISAESARRALTEALRDPWPVADGPPG